MNTIFNTFITYLINSIKLFVKPYSNIEFSNEIQETIKDGCEVVVFTTTLKMKPKTEDKVEKKEEEKKVVKKEEKKTEDKVEKKKEKKTEKKKVEKNVEKKEEKKTEDKVEKKEEKKIEEKKEDKKDDKKEEDKVDEVDKDDWIEVKSKKTKENFGKYQDLIINFMFNFKSDLYQQIETLISYTQSAQTFNKGKNLSIVMFEDILYCIVKGYKYNPTFYSQLLINFIKRIKNIYKNSRKGWFIDEKTVDFGLIVKECFPKSNPEFIENYKTACNFFFNKTLGMKGWTKESRKTLGDWLRSL